MRIFSGATTLFRVAGIVVFFAGMSWANSSVQREIKGDFGFYVKGLSALPLPFAEIGRFTADGEGGITGHVITQTSMGAGLPSATSTSAFSGTYALNADGTGTMTLTIGDFHFVIDDNGNEIRLVQDSSAAAGIARQQRGPFTALANGNVPGYLRNPSGECSGLFTPVPSPPQFPFGIPLEVGLTAKIANGTITESGFYSSNGFSGPVAFSGTISFNANGTFQGNNDGQGFIGVLIAQGQDYFTMGTHPETIEICINHQ